MKSHLIPSHANFYVSITKWRHFSRFDREFIFSAFASVHFRRKRRRKCRKNVANYSAKIFYFSQLWHFQCISFSTHAKTINFNKTEFQDNSQVFFNCFKGRNLKISDVWKVDINGLEPIHVFSWIKQHNKSRISQQFVAFLHFHVIFSQFLTKMFF